jgi:chemotaxis methyl-accepting protein methylase
MISYHMLNSMTQEAALDMISLKHYVIYFKNNNNDQLFNEIVLSFLLEP